MHHRLYRGIKGPKHGGANEVAYDIQKRYRNADDAEADIRERIAKKRLSSALDTLSIPSLTPVMW